VAVLLVNKFLFFFCVCLFCFVESRKSDGRNMNFVIQVLLVIGMLARANAECFNGCSGHGACSSSDSCSCNKGYDGNDCSERICPSGYAHVDSPRGDIDGDATVTGADKIVGFNSFSYPYGIVESGPRNLDTELNVVSDSGHEYMTCSNKGTCDTTTGTCTCITGYGGHACQRTECPNDCSGKGVCQSISQIANSQGGVYALWDKESTYGCVCDAGYYGADCSMKKCKIGTDALYFDDYTSQNFATFYMFVLSNKYSELANETDAKFFEDGTVDEGEGTWRITFFDPFGEDYTTERLNDDASCQHIQDALYRLPGNVVPDGSVQCSKYTIRNHTTANLTTSSWEDVTYTPSTVSSDTIFGHERFNEINLKTSEVMAAWYGYGGFNTKTVDYLNAGENHVGHVDGHAYQLRFSINGVIKDPKIEIHTDGTIPTLNPSNSYEAEMFIDHSRLNQVITAVFTNGEQGEEYDYFADHCDGVTVTIDYHNYKLIPSDVTVLKRCLADADNDWSNQLTIDNYDPGNSDNPHLVKLVKSSTGASDGGHYVPLKINGDDFNMLIPWKGREFTATGGDGVYEVFTTKGTLERVSETVDTFFNTGDDEIYTINWDFEDRTVHGGTNAKTRWSGDLSCEATSNTAKFNDQTYGIRENRAGESNCLSIGDKIFLIGSGRIGVNTGFLNMYTVEALNTLSPIDKDSNLNLPSALGTHQIKVFPNLNHGHIAPDNNSSGLNSTRLDADLVQVYKFTPHRDSTYHVVAECSNRGICDVETGICHCFNGYQGDSCQQQSVVSC